VRNQAEQLAWEAGEDDPQPCESCGELVGRFDHHDHQTKGAKMYEPLWNQMTQTAMSAEPEIDEDEVMNILRVGLEVFCEAAGLLGTRSDLIANAPDACLILTELVSVEE